MKTQISKIFSVEGVSTLIAFLALCLSFINQCEMAEQQSINEEIVKKSDSLAYTLNQVTHRPILKVTEGKINCKLSMESKLAVKDIKKMFSQILDIEKRKFTSDSVEIIQKEMQSIFKLNAEVNISNVGIAISRLYGIVMADTISTLPRLRLELTDENKLINLKTRYFEDFFRLELIPGEQSKINLDFNLNFLKEDSFIAHILIIYENEFGQLFDTYFWIKLENIPTVFNLAFLIDEDGQVKLSLLPEEDVQKAKIEVKNQSFYAYTSREKEIILRKLNNPIDG